MLISWNKTRELACSAACLALCIALPFLTGQIPRIGNALCPMHLPVFLSGFLCGPWWAAAVGITAPLLRFTLFGTPQLFPVGAAMSVELGVYGLVCGGLHRRFRDKGVWAALIPAMLLGRAAWGLTMLVLMGPQGFSWQLFWAGAFVNAIPGIILQLVVMPVLAPALQKVLGLPQRSSL